MIKTNRRRTKVKMKTNHRRHRPEKGQTYKENAENKSISLDRCKYFSQSKLTATNIMR